MFTGKIYINRNGKVIEKEFDNATEYRSFLAEHDIPNLYEEFPRLTLGGWSHFHNYLNNLIHEKVALPSLYPHHEHTKSPTPTVSGKIDFSEYEKELEQLELSQNQLKVQLQSLHSDLEKLEQIKNKFINHGKDDKDDMMQRIHNDIKIIKEDIKNIEKKIKK